MGTIVHPLTTIHQSDPSCLARVKAQHDNPLPSGPAAMVGTICHEIIETYTVQSAERPGISPRAVTQAVIDLRARDPEATPEVLEQVVRLMSRVFAKDSPLHLGLPPSPWETVAEWRWALDENLEPVPPCGNCGGTLPEELAPPCLNCAGRGHFGWEREPAFSGTIDRLEFHRAEGKVRIYDYKTILEHESGEDIAVKRQAKWYSIAVLRHFPGVGEVEFHEVNLRHRYTARATFVRGAFWEEETVTRMKAERAGRLLAIAQDCCQRCGGTGEIADDI